MAAISAYPRIDPTWLLAIPNPSPKVGSPPRNLISAAPTRAELAKIITKYWTR
ncbi:MAG TPA: hypothetical protein HA349_04520 [Methanotrichaceae archaeon]|nr:hypothetical protein [Methanotrichaceae archaeon]